MTTMRAAVVEAIGGPLHLRELPVPVPGQGEILIRLDSSGVCHTDLSIIDGEWPMRKPRFPIVPGHEGCGHVAGCGPGVTSFKEGDRVGAFWLNWACGACEHCATGREPLCGRQEGTGFTASGTYADYCVVSAAYAVALPKGELAQFAPIMCAGVTSYKAVKDLNLAPGSWVAVIGLGGTGHLAVQYAKAMGLRVAAVDLSDDRLAHATAHGAAIALNAERQFPVNRIVNQTGGVHAAIVTANSAKAFEQAMRMLRRGGTCVLVGIAPEALSIAPFDMVIKGLTVRGSLIGTRQDLAEAVQLTAEGTVVPRLERRPLEQVNAALADLKDRRVCGRVVLSMA